MKVFKYKINPVLSEMLVSTVRGYDGGKVTGYMDDSIRIFSDKSMYAITTITYDADDNPIYNGISVVIARTISEALNTYTQITGEIGWYLCTVESKLTPDLKVEV